MKGRRPRCAGVGAVLLACWGLWAAAEDVLLKNPSFEDPKQRDNWFSDQAAHWERWGDWINRETCWQPTADGECLIGYHHWKIQGDRSSGLFQDIPLARRGVEYTFSVQVYKDPGATMDTIELRIEPSGGGPPIASRTYPVRSLKSKDWIELSVTGRPLTDGIRVVVEVRPQRGRRREGALKFDRACLTSLDTAAFRLGASAVPR